MALPPASDKPKGIGSPKLVTITYAAAALNAIAVSEGITNFFHTTTDGDILNRPRIRRLGYQKFRNITPQLYYLLRIRIDDHVFLYIQRTGGRNF
jgi:hypothetical protein